MNYLKLLTIMEIELMAPAGSFESLMAAINAGAESVYFGVGELNMRAGSSNFTEADLEKVLETCRKNNVRAYLTLNSVVYDEDYETIKKLCDFAKKLGVSAIIASDISVIKYAREIGLEVHLSTQCNVANIEAVEFYSKFADVIVLARELKLEQIKKICDEIKERKIIGPSGEFVEIEIFVHGALCVSVSGKCYMSLAQYNSSANRGKCLQACRRGYRVIDEETGDELVIENNYVMSPKDLCTIEIIDDIVKSGVSILKIEGRGRSPEYVDMVVRVYKKALDEIKKGTYSKEKALFWKKELERVFNRGFWEGGYYLGEKVGEWAGIYGSKATEKKIEVGAVKNYYVKPKIVEVSLLSGDVKVGDEILITGLGTGVLRTKITELRVEEKEKEIGIKGESVTFPLESRARVNDKVYVLKKL